MSRDSKFHGRARNHFFGAQTRESEGLQNLPCLPTPSPQAKLDHLQLLPFVVALKCICNQITVMFKTKACRQSFFLRDNGLSSSLCQGLHVQSPSGKVRYEKSHCARHPAVIPWHATAAAQTCFVFSRSLARARNQRFICPVVCSILNRACASASWMLLHHRRHLPGIDMERLQD